MTTKEQVRQAFEASRSYRPDEMYWYDEGNPSWFVTERTSGRRWEAVPHNNDWTFHQIPS